MAFNATGDNKSYNKTSFKDNLIFVGVLLLAMLIALGTFAYFNGGPDANSNSPANNSVNSNVQR